MCSNFQKTSRGPISPIHTKVSKHLNTNLRKKVDRLIYNFGDMGSFGGHALPGSFFMVFGLWWTFQTYRRYFITKKNRGGFRCTPTTKCDFLCGCAQNYEIEGLLKVILVSIGAILELWTGFRCPNFCSGNIHHIAMFFFFGLSGVCDLLVHHKADLPGKSQYVSLLMGLFVELLLFRYHLHGRPEMDTELHTLLTYSIGLSMVAVAMEMHHQTSALCMLARSFCSLLQGSWFWQIAFVLYPPYNSGKTTWDMSSHDQMMQIAAMFAGHMAGHVLLFLALGLLMGRYYRAGSSSLDDGLRLIQTGDDDFKIDGEEGMLKK